MSTLRNTHRRFARVAIKVIQRQRIFFYKLISWCRLDGAHPKLFQPLLSTGDGIISFGKNVRLGVYPSPNFFDGICYLEARAETARISIGDNCWINNGFTAIAESTSIAIGPNCLVGPRVTIFDSDFHGLAPAERNDPDAVVRKSVTIGANVFIGADVLFVKGAVVGDNSVVAAGSVVVGEIPPNVTAAGNPARVLRAL